MKYSFIEKLSTDTFSYKVRNIPDIYNFPIFDIHKIHSKPFIMSLFGKKDSLKTRFSLYLAKNIVKNGFNVFCIFLSDFSQYFFELECEEVNNQLVIIMENNLENLQKILSELPDNSHIIIDNFHAIHSTLHENMNREYYECLKIIKSFTDKKKFRIYINEGINYYTKCPLTKIGETFIDYFVLFKKLKKTKKLIQIKNSFKEITSGYYYLISEKHLGKQLVYAGIQTPISDTDLKFLYLLEKKFIDRKGRYYYKDNFKLDLNNKDFIRRIYEEYRKGQIKS